MALLQSDTRLLSGLLFVTLSLSKGTAEYAKDAEKNENKSCWGC